MWKQLPATARFATLQLAGGSPSVSATLALRVLRDPGQKRASSGAKKQPVMEILPLRRLLPQLKVLLPLRRLLPQLKAQLRELVAQTNQMVT